VTSAKIICDSVSPQGHRLTTFEVVMHRFVLSEFNTHRVLSKNSASSRAIPVQKQLARVEANPAIPLSWPQEQKGMQGGEELDEGGRLAAENVWLRARTSAAVDAQALIRTGVHKSVVNRLLEPFMWHTVVVTGTAWANFFALRNNPMAQPEIRVAAEQMQQVYAANEPTLLGEGQWHLPYIQGGEYSQHDTETLVQISSARCARVSYLTQTGVRDPQEDLTLYERLISASPMHASPLEHVATPAPWNWQLVTTGDQVTMKGLDVILPKYGNLLGWHQHRFDVEAAKDYKAYA
jgi:thymidylate synthase ThyX